ncbi:unnamed protein product [Arctogadus glacialis]
MNGIRTERLAEKLLRLGNPEHCSWFPAPLARFAHRQNASHRGTYYHTVTVIQLADVRQQVSSDVFQRRAAVGSGLSPPPEPTGRYRR